MYIIFALCDLAERQFVLLFLLTQVIHGHFQIQFEIIIVKYNAVHETLTKQIYSLYVHKQLLCNASIKPFLIEIK